MGITGIFFLIALCFGIGAVLFFLWAIRTGQFRQVEDIKYKMLEQESNEPEITIKPQKS